LTNNIEENEGVHSGFPVDSAHRTFENPYFVLVRRKLVAATGGFADVEGVCALYNLGTFLLEGSFLTTDTRRTNPRRTRR
jgi:hypothetical protein